MDLTEKQILERLKEIDRIVDPGECNQLSNALSFFIYEALELGHLPNLGRLRVLLSSRIL